jgi:hypothetical protein
MTQKEILCPFCQTPMLWSEWDSIVNKIDLNFGGVYRCPSEIGGCEALVLPTPLEG